jgi:hypothetical protein
VRLVRQALTAMQIITQGAKYAPQEPTARLGRPVAPPVRQVHTRPMKCSGIAVNVRKDRTSQRKVLAAVCRAMHNYVRLATTVCNVEGEVKENVLSAQTNSRQSSVRICPVSHASA